GDGRLDLVRGNRDQGATLYLGTVGGFAHAPAWTGPVERTVSIALGDLDGDGDLDLVRGNIDPVASIYLNDGGTFTATPVATIAVDSSWCVALGDVDGDGALDAMLGLGELHLNRSPWIVNNL